MMDYMDIGAAPPEETPLQVGSPGYNMIAAKAECQRYRDLIRTVLGPEPDGAQLFIKINIHEFGNYPEVVCRYDDSKPEAVTYAYACERIGPLTWGDDKPRDYHGILCGEQK